MRKSNWTTRRLGSHGIRTASKRSALKKIEEKHLRIYKSILELKIK